MNISSLLSLNGRVLVVTGASRGIGLAVGQMLHDAGSAVLLVARNADELGCVASRIGDQARVAWLAGDITGAPFCEAVVQECMSRWGRIDGLINNAGLNRPMQLMAPDLEGFDQMLDLNLRAPLRLTRLTYQAGLAANHGVVVNIVSTAALRTFSGHGLRFGGYGTSKAALAHLTRNLALELAPEVRVNAVAPGVTGTDRVLRMLGGADTEPAALIPLRRVGRVEEIAAAVLFLVSEAASYITGEVLIVDGGGVLV